MKMLRGGSTARTWSVTDRLTPDRYVGSVAEERCIRFDGTIQKLGGRHTDLKLKIEENDIVPLATALVQNATAGRLGQILATMCNRLSTEVSRLEQETKGLREAMTKIRSLEEIHYSKAPSAEELSQAMSTVAFFYEDEGTITLDKDPSQWNFHWIKWEEI